MSFDYTVSLSNPIIKSEIETRFANIQNKFGNIINEDISSDAGIALSKLSASYQELCITIAADEWGAANAIIAATPLPGSNGDTAWVVTDIQWICTDSGNGAGTFDVVWGEYDAAGTWTTTTTVASAIALSNANSVADTANDARGLEGGSVSLAFATGARSLAIRVNAAGANILTATTGFLVVSVILRRQIIP